MNVISIMNLFDWYYWFHQPYIARGMTMWIWVIFFLFFVFSGLVLKFISQRIETNYLKKTINSFSNIGLSVGLLGLLWMFFRQERVPFLAWRFWLIIIFGIAIWRKIVNIIFLVRRAPIIKKEQAEKIAKAKYLPK